MLASKKYIRELLKKYKALPLKRLGQNFLINKNALEKFIRAVDIRKDNVVIEIGPGTGLITKELSKKAKKIIAIEKDPRMIEILENNLKSYKNVKIVKGDILRISLTEFFKNSKGQKIKNFSYKVAGNLPFAISAPVIRKFLEAERKPREMTFIIQKEVAQKICARPPKMNLLAVSIQIYSKPKVVGFISKKSFWPEPKADGAIIKIIPFKSPLLPPKISAGLFFKIAKAGFSHPRKQILNNLSNKLKLKKEAVRSWLLKNKVDPSQRAESLTIKNWISLTSSFYDKIG